MSTNINISYKINATTFFILIAGIGGMTLKFGQITLTEIAVALILGIIANLVLNRGKDAEDEKTEESEKVEK